MRSWMRERTVHTTATPAQVWARWTDAAAWASDDPGVRWAVFDGRPRPGGTGRVKNHGSPVQRFTFTAVVEEQRMDLQIRLPLARLTIAHLAAPADAGLAVTHQLRLEGPLAGLYGVLVGSRLAAGLSEVVDRVVAGALSTDRSKA